MATFAKSTFSAASYAAFRPSYPPSLYDRVITHHRGPKRLCLDHGCGTGIVTRDMSKYFDRIIGIDPSAGMVKHARQNSPSSDFPNVEYYEVPAESAPFLEDGSVDMVVAGQAAHWFDYPRWFAELKRIVRPGGTMAVWGYKDHVFVDFPRASQIVDDFCYGKDALGPYWSMPGRSYVQDKLRIIQPPPNEWGDVERIEYEPGFKGKGSGEGELFMERSMKVGECKEYTRTWSSYHSWQLNNPGKEARIRGGDGDFIDEMFDAIANENAEFKDEDRVVDIEWGSALIIARKI